MTIKDILTHLDLHNLDVKEIVIENVKELPSAVRGKLVSMPNAMYWSDGTRWYPLPLNVAPTSVVNKIAVEADTGNIIVYNGDGTRQSIDISLIPDAEVDVVTDYDLSDSDTETVSQVALNDFDAVSDVSFKKTEATALTQIETLTTPVAVSKVTPSSTSIIKGLGTPTTQRVLSTATTVETTKGDAMYASITKNGDDDEFIIELTPVELLASVALNKNTGVDVVTGYDNPEITRVDQEVAVEQKSVVESISITPTSTQVLARETDVAASKAVISKVTETTPKTVLKSLGKKKTTKVVPGYGLTVTGTTENA